MITKLKKIGSVEDLLARFAFLAAAACLILGQPALAHPATHAHPARHTHCAIDPVRRHATPRCRRPAQRSAAAQLGEKHRHTRSTVTYAHVAPHEAAPLATDATTSAVTSGGGNGTLMYDGTFNGWGSNYPEIYGTCASLLSSTELQLNVSGSCDPGGDGHYRTDYASPNVYPAGIPECTSVPFDMVNLPTVPGSSWFGFAEAKDAAANLAGWGFGVTSYYGGVNELQVEFNGYNNAAPAWTSTGGIPSGWNTLSICTNDANNNSGQVYGIWLNGIRQTFNHGPDAGSQALSGFAIIDDGVSSWPLDINDYTGGAPANHIIHGDPLVATMGANGLPPKPSGGWNSP